MVPKQITQKIATSRQFGSNFTLRQQIELAVSVRVRTNLNSSHFQVGQVATAQHGCRRQHTFSAPIAKRAGGHVERGWEVTRQQSR
jgi:hypothetical protein